MFFGSVKEGGISEGKELLLTVVVVEEAESAYAVEAAFLQ
jgi:hypothetical protein